MSRLSRYLLRLFTSEAMALFGVAAFLLFLIQCLRLFDVVADKGQSMVTLIGQALLGMPSLGIVFLYVCLGIGLGRALRNLQASSELGVIHTNRLLPVLLRAVGIYTAGGAIALLVLAHIVEPVSVRASSSWSASIAADLVSHALIPHRFTEIAHGVSIVIGSRDSAGNIADFFADDHRSEEQQRTYFAQSAVITQDEQGYVLRMHDGAIQYFTADNRFSQVSFTRYDLALDNLTSASEPTDSLALRSSLDILKDGKLSADAAKTLLKRTGEALRAIAICLFVTAISAFPTGKRARFEIPIEITVLGAAFLERAVTSYLPGPGILGVASGSILLTLAGAATLVVRLRVFQPVHLGRRTA
jgi:lipopolysaccharide export system permease protein